MAEGDRSTLFSKTDNDSVLSGSVCYFTELREDDEVLSEAGSEVSLLIHTEDVIHPYLFEPAVNLIQKRWIQSILGKSGPEAQTGTRMKVLCVLHQYRTCFYRCTWNFCHWCRQLVSPFAIKNSTMFETILEIISWRSSSSLYHYAHWFKHCLLVRSCIVDCLSWAPTPLWN